MSDSHKPLYIFLHIPRTAGTTITHHIARNFTPEETLRLYPDELGMLNSNKRYYSQSDYKEMINSYVSRIPKKQKNNIKIIFGHYVYKGIEKYFDKDPYFFTVVRDPVNRAISSYNFWATSYYHSRNINFLVKNGFLIDGKVETDVYKWNKAKTKDHNVSSFSLNLDRYLSYLNFNTDLSDFDFVGLTEKSRNDFLYIYNLLDIDTHFPRSNVSRVYQKTVHKKALKDYISTYTNDYQIYKRALKLNRMYKQKHTDFYDKVSSQRRKQMFSLYPLRAIVRRFS